MAPNPDLRASDADRDRTAESLREHCAEGRITMEELQERLDAVYAAKTLGQLQEVTSDLPEEDLYQLPVPASQPKSTASAAVRASSGDLEHRRLQAMWGAWAVVGGINLVIWLILTVQGAADVYPWWIWVAGPWGALLLLRTVLGRRHDG
ncbi:DUF1707 domain-containing protein [Actinomadura sp. KC216]|uniref:DUF1707 SHOCT-like domain-containing protein n=1 Tax=Actinomadura sp. KC216 TaxID=2530370 RepID=UPI001051EE59|nr:DUF1707 domain-containing protein [Actinomadura sp. KC216]TDB91311.1 DUF1707 domain-containing protein [Actinomadura sp. KC216]